MGNTAGKEVRTRSNFENIVGDESFGPSDASLLSTGAFAREFLGYDINSNNLLNGSNGRDNSGFFNKKKKEKEMEKLKFKTMQIFNLVIKYEENVDGGYLAPYANYKYNLDYATNIVKGLITSRNLSPFFTPLEEFDESWTDEELLSYLYENLKLHEDIKPNDLIDDFEDPNDHRLTQSANVIKRQENKLFKQRLKERAAELQNLENVRFLKEFKASRSDMGKKYEDIPNDDLLLRVYRNSEECPICFLYYPNMLNVTKCCNQRICTECFVQMKRLEPHFPHDENGEIGTDVTPVDDETDSRPENLISEPVKCPFCANEEFGISYTPPKDFKTGLKSDCKASAYENGDKNTVEDEVTEIDLEDPFSQKTANSSAKANKKTFDNTNGNRESKDQSPMIITIDTIRPDWEQKLLSARTKMARRSAAATALHASSLLSNDTDVEHGRSRRRRSTANSHHRHHNHERRDSGRIVSRQDQDELEQRMIEEAMRLSLLDEEERKMKERIKGKK